MIPAYALYRRSTSAQDLSIDQQRAAVEQWASEHGYRVVRDFSDDASGLDTARRKGFRSLLEICEIPDQRAANVVLTYDVSRFSRLDPDEAAYHEFSLKLAGVRVIYTHDPGANDPGIGGVLAKAIKRGLANEHSTKLSEVVRRGQRAHAQLGHWIGGTPPYGYRRALLGPAGPQPLAPGKRKAKDDTVVLIPDPAQIKIVHDLIFLPYVQGIGILTISRRLNEQHIPPPAAHRRQGKAGWGKSTIWSILRNPVYAGRLTFGKARYREIGKKRGKTPMPISEHIVVENVVPAIIPHDVWAIAQATHGTRGQGLGRHPNRDYLLTGLILCGSCGKRYHAQSRTHGPAIRYVCGGYSNSGRSFCTSPTVLMVYLDDAIVDGIQKRLERVLPLKELRRRVEVALADTGPQNRVSDLEKSLQDTKLRARKLVDEMAAGAAAFAAVRERLAELETTRGDLERELAEARLRARRPHASDAIDTILARLEHIRTVLEAGTHEQRRAVIACFLKGIRIEAATRRAVLSWFQVPQDRAFMGVAVEGVNHKRTFYDRDIPLSTVR